MPGKLEIPSAYRGRSCPVFVPGSGPCQGVRELRKKGDHMTAAGKCHGAEGKVVQGLEKRVGFNHSAEAKCSVSGRSSVRFDQFRGYEMFRAYRN